MSTRVLPTFLLKGVNPNELLTKYKQGHFAGPPEFCKQIKLSQNRSILAPVYGNNNTDPIFTVKDRNNSSVVVATSGHQNFETFTKNGGQLPVGGRCDHCKWDFDHLSIGYPVAYKEQTILTNTADEAKNAVYRVLYIFWVEGCFCSFECALCWICGTLSRSANFRDTALRDSERMLKLLHRLTYPQAKNLRPAQDFRLLKSNGGSLDRETWEDRRHIYVRTDRVLTIPAKFEYFQQKFDVPQA